ncbi:MAG: hypothetical protein ACTHOR_00265 [Devosia sp.]
MTMAGSTDTIIVTDSGQETPARDYVDWPAVIAGIVLASAIGLVMLTFGSAIGLSLANFHGGNGVSGIWIGIIAASWLLWVEVSSLMAGGYLAGRLRRRIHDATEHESDVRDGAHGLLVWGGALIVSALLAFAGVGGAISTLGSVASTATTAVASAAGPAAGAAAQKSGFDPNAYFADALLRPAPPAAETAAPAGGTAAAPAAGTAAAPAASNGTTAGATPAPASGTAAPATAAAPSPAASTAASTGGANRAEATAEAGRILTNAAVSGSMPDEDKTYLAQLVSENTGLSQDDAKKRVDGVLANIDAAKQKAADAAETARRTTVLAAFLTAASLLVAAAAAYWAASMGGRHRDEQTVFADFFRRY